MSRSTRASSRRSKLIYTLCHPVGCIAEIEATPELLNDLKTAGGLVVFRHHAGGARRLPGAARGFDQSLCRRAGGQQQ